MEERVGNIGQGDSRPWRDYPESRAIDLELDIELEIDWNKALAAVQGTERWPNDHMLSHVVVSEPHLTQP